MSGYYGRGYQGSWGRARGGGHAPSKFGGKGAGKGANLPSLLNQLQSEIAAQQQLQAIASVLTPGNSFPVPTPPVPEPSPSHLGTADAFKQLQDEISVLRSEVAKARASEPQPPQASPEASGILTELKQALAELRPPKPQAQASSGPPPTKSNAQAELATQLQSLRAELDSLKSSQVSTKRKRPQEPKNPVGGEGFVTKAEHKDFFKDVLQKKSLLAKVASMPVDEWVAIQAAKLSQDDFDTMLAKFSPDLTNEDQTDDAVLKLCLQQWRLGRSGHGDAATRTN